MLEYLERRRSAFQGHIQMCRLLTFSCCQCTNGSDSGGGNVDNSELNNASVALQWMVNESATAGLIVEPSKVIWDMEKLRTMRPTKSLTLPYRIIEILPITHLTYRNPTEIARYVICYVSGLLSLLNLWDTGCGTKAKGVLSCRAKQFMRQFASLEEIMCQRRRSILISGALSGRTSSELGSLIMLPGRRILKGSWRWIFSTFLGFRR